MDKKIENIQKYLKQKNQLEYGEQYCEHYFEQYKLYLENTVKLSSKRQLVNTFYLSLNTVLFTFFKFEFLKEIFILVVGIVICFAWYFTIKSYEELTKHKFMIINKIEMELPLAPYFTEWIVFKKKKKFSFSNMEKYIPILFGFAYFIAIILSS